MATITAMSLSTPITPILLVANIKA